MQNGCSYTVSLIRNHTDFYTKILIQFTTNAICVTFTNILRTKSLSTEPETFGFDPQLGQTWIYPTNYPTREYQFNIIEAALFKNTLVNRHTLALTLLC